ncbi:MAG: 1-phosphofructokinase [Lachnospiraceae bacterium]
MLCLIYTVTLNPSLDYVVNVNNLNIGGVNRAQSDLVLAGGKGINVSLILNELGMDNTAIGFVAGFTGREIVRRVSESGCNCRFIEMAEGLSRINVKIKDKKETEINAAGPKIDKEYLEELWKILDEIEAGDMIVLAGSIPASMPQKIYADITRKMSGKGVKVIADTSGAVLHDLINMKPFLVKPNQDELYELFDVRVSTLEEAKNYAKKLREMGAQNALVSMGEVGAVLAAADGKVYSCMAPMGNAVNTVGAGDSMVAGFITGILAEVGYEDALKLSIAAGSATAFSKNLATKKEIQELYEIVKK